MEGTVQKVSELILGLFDFGLSDIVGLAYSLITNIKKNFCPFSPAKPVCNQPLSRRGISLLIVEPNLHGAPGPDGLGCCVQHPEVTGAKVRFWEVWGIL
jgi:hypothetical protein